MRQATSLLVSQINLALVLEEWETNHWTMFYGDNSDFSNVKKWLNLESTKEALGVDLKHSHAWNSCNFGINAKFHSDWMKTFAPFVSDLLNAGIPALIYAGDVDFICNYVCFRFVLHNSRFLFICSLFLSFFSTAWQQGLDTQAWLEGQGRIQCSWRTRMARSWFGSYGWRFDLFASVWCGPYGKSKKQRKMKCNSFYSHLHFCSVQVPADQPKVALDMIKNFVDGGSF